MSSPRIRSRPRGSPPRGFVLPVVLVAMLLVSTLAGASAFAAWRNMRSARLGWNGERALLAADEAIARTVATLQPDSFATLAIGSRSTRTVNSADNVPVSVTIARTAPLVAMMAAEATSPTGALLNAAHRRVTRAVYLMAPVFPVRGALTVLDSVQLGGAGNVDGRDNGLGSDGCDALRDTASVSSVHAVTADIGPAVILDGVPAAGLPSVARTGSGTAVTLANRISFDSAWAVASTRTANVETRAAPASLVPSAAWSVRLLRPDTLSTPRVTLTGLAQHTGLLMVDGDLAVQGTLELNGLLVVRGALDASSGTLVVNGAVIVRDRGARGSTVTAGTVHYSPCRVQRALAAIARPSTKPFALWTPH